MRTFDLGDVIAEQCLTFEADAGWSREVQVRIGRPVRDPAEPDGPWLCPYQIVGLGRDRVMAIFGVDAMQALVLALRTVPAELAAFKRDPGGRVLHHVRQADSLAADRSAEPFFLNVDLDIETDVDPEPLVRALEPHAYSLERPPGRASFELDLPVTPSTPDPLIREFVRLVKALPPGAREVWDRASRRVFDIGIQSRRHHPSETHHLTGAMLREAAEVGAEIAFTVYALGDT